jgi:outer membrane protein assembly factor BamA
MSHRVAAATAIVAWLATMPCPASAQQTRQELLERQRAEKAQKLAPYEPGKVEKWVLKFENPGFNLSPHNGFFVKYGYSHKPRGSGLGVGTGYRHDLFDRFARVELEGGITYKNYQLLRADFSLPYLLQDRLEIGAEALYHHLPQEDFYGLGPEAIEEDRTSYRYDAQEYQGRVVGRPRDWLEFGARTGRLKPSIGTGTDDAFPSIEELFNPLSVPGLAAQPDFLYNDVFAEIDYRDQPGNARDGGAFSVSWRWYNDLDLDRHGFRVFDAAVQQFFPIFDKKRVFAIHARVISATPGEGQEVPFYYKPTVGGDHSVRSLRDFRFRDDNALLINFEYRWEAFSILDMALFTDWGKVAQEFGDLDLGDMRRAYGIGFRFATAKAVFFRFDIATGGGEGVRYLLKYSKMF